MASTFMYIIPLLSSIFLLLLGIILAFLGASNVLLLQRISHTPTSKVRSAAIGLSELSGKAAIAEPLKSHIEGSDSVCTRLQLEKYSRMKKKWVRVALAQENRPFYLSDDTGRMLVDPSGAEFEFSFRAATYEVFLLRSGRAATGRQQIYDELRAKDAHYSFGPLQDYVLSGKEPASDDPIIASIIVSLPAQGNAGKEAKTGLESALAVNRFLDKNKGYAERFRSLAPGELRVIEEAVRVGESIYVLGSVESKAGSHGSAPHGETLLMRKGRDGVLLISDTSEKTLISAKTVKAFALIICGLAAIAMGIFLLQMLL